MTTFLLAGGGTAGHVNPLLATADELLARHPGDEVLVLGTAEGLEARLVPERGYELVTIPKLPFPRRPGRDATGFPRALRALNASVAATIREREVDVVVGFGGYAAAPAYLAARSTRTPLVVHEANARPGLANRLGSRLTRFVGVTFRDTPLRNARVVGLPLRREIEHLDREAARAHAYRAFHLDRSRPTLLVTGGSLGAQRINQAVRGALDDLLGSGTQVLHITGARDAPDPSAATPAGYHPMAYCDAMHLAFSVADLAVSRAGAATVAELGAVGVPALLVPYAVGNGEQRLNARDLVRAGGALLIGDRDLTPARLLQAVLPLLGDRRDLERMRDAAYGTGVRDGSARLADLVEEAVRAR